jgi:hypothetical protein
MKIFLTKVCQIKKHYYFCLMIQNYRKNKAYIKFIDSVKKSSEYTSLKRVVDILEDDDLESIKSPLTYRQRKLLGLLDQLILDTISFFSLSSKELSPERPVLEIISNIDQKLLQIQKLRMTILPEIIPNVVIHSVTKHKYVVLRSYWLNDGFKKIRKYSISLGNAENLDNLKNINPIDFTNEYTELANKMVELYHSEYS